MTATWTRWRSASWAWHRDGWADAVLGCATPVKFFPFAVAPAFLRGGRLWHPASAGAGVTVVLYALYGSAGRHVLGFSPYYSTEKGLADGGGFRLLSDLSRLVTLPAGATVAYAACTAAALLALALPIARGHVPGGGNDTATPSRDTSLLAAAMAAVGAHYPWYSAWPVLPCAVAPSRTVFWLLAPPLLLHFDPWPHACLTWPSLVYFPTALLPAVDLWPRRARGPSTTAVPGEKQACPLQQH